VRLEWSAACVARDLSRSETGTIRPGGPGAGANKFAPAIQFGRLEVDLKVIADSFAGSRRLAA